MKFIEIRGSVRVPVSNEELLVLERVKQSDEPLPKARLDIREKELARQLVHKGVLDRVMIDEQICFVYNDTDDLWR